MLNYITKGIEQNENNNIKLCGVYKNNIQCNVFRGCGGISNWMLNTFLFVHTPQNTSKNIYRRHFNTLILKIRYK